MRSRDADLAVVNFDPQGQMVAAISPALDPHPLAVVAANLRSAVVVAGLLGCAVQYGLGPEAGFASDLHSTTDFRPSCRHVSNGPKAGLIRND